MCKKCNFNELKLNELDVQKLELTDKHILVINLETKSRLLGETIDRIMVDIKRALAPLKEKIGFSTLLIHNDTERKITLNVIEKK